jgi:hypothetical protein
MAQKAQGSTDRDDLDTYVSHSPAEDDSDNWRNWLKRCREEEEVDADLRGRSTGSVFTSYVPPGMVQKQQPKKQPKKQPKQQPRRNPDRGTKIQKKPPCKGGFTDRDISSPKLKAAVIAELRQLGPMSLPAKDQEPDAAGRVLHFPQELVIRGGSKANLQCYLPALCFASGLDKPLPTQVTKVLENADASQINMVRIITLLLLNTDILLFAGSPASHGVDAGEAGTVTQ